MGSRALLVTGRDPERAAPLRSPLSREGVASVVFPTPGEPTVELVRQGAQLARQERCELVIGFGGGSPMDAAKAIAALAACEGDVLDYLEVIGQGRPLPGPGLPFIAIPTTAGTGAEVTRNAVLASTEHKVKASLRSPYLLARLAIVDPELTYQLPAAVTATSGMDALTQLIEPYVSLRRSPLIDPLCLDGIQRIARSLLRAYQEGGDRQARLDMSLAGLLSGLALANAGLGAVHGLAAVIGGAFPAPHGAVCAALLAPVMEANLRALRSRAPQNEALPRYETIARILTGSPSAAAEDGPAAIRRLCFELRLPSLSAYGLATSHLPSLADAGLRSNSMKANPVPLTRDELIAVLAAAL
jgi:alcohol dehydrogenase class IV